MRCKSKEKEARKRERGRKENEMAINFGYLPKTKTTRCRTKENPSYDEKYLYCVATDNADAIFDTRGVWKKKLTRFQKWLAAVEKLFFVSFSVCCRG